jgi:hypothetical protein
MENAQHREFTKADVDLRPITAPATWFPGALPRDTIRRLKEMDKNIVLKWSPRFECWELWHKNPNGYEHVFYRHQTRAGGFIPADDRLVGVVEMRSRQTAWGQDRERKENQYLSDHLKEQDKPMVQKRRERMDKLKGDFGADSRAF